MKVQKSSVGGRQMIKGMIKSMILHKHLKLNTHKYKAKEQSEAEKINGTAVMKMVKQCDW